MKFKLIILLIVSMFFLQCKNEKSNKVVLGPNDVFCDAEEITKDGVQFISYGNKFNAGNTRTEEEAYEGKYSCVLDKETRFGMSFALDSLVPGEYIRISAYRKGASEIGTIVIQDMNAKNYYQSQNKACSKKDENGWEYMSLDVQLPYDISLLSKLKVYVYKRSTSEERVFFDNFKIERKYKYKDDVSSQHKIELLIPDNDLLKLRGYRDLALLQKTISGNLKKEIEGLLVYNGKNIPVAIRLKGDWTDHLSSRKWSFRIKVKNGEAFLGLKSFSIQAPEIRNYLHEWVAHKVCEKESLLTTRMEYLPVSINGIDLGLYNLEEHFEKQLVESKQRREGPILKFSEDSFWDIVLYNKKAETESKAPYYLASVISPFKVKKTLKTEKLKNQFLIAQNLLYGYKKGIHNLEDVIDIERYAKAYALMDLFNVSHSFNWHNQRFYYNPITSKLEFIVYDCYPGAASHKDGMAGITGNINPGEGLISKLELYITRNPFNNTLFKENYIKAIEVYSSKKYITELMEQLEPGLDSLINLIQVEEPNYYYDKEFLKDNAKRIRKELPDFRTKVKNEQINYSLKKSELKQDGDWPPFKSISVVAHIEDEMGLKLSLVNYHCKPLKIVGFSTKQQKGTIIKMTNNQVLKKFSNEERKYFITLKQRPHKLYYQVVGMEDDSVYNVKVVPWKRPSITPPYEDMMNKKLNRNSKIYILKDDSIIFKDGVHLVNENIIIPEGFTVFFQPGTELVFNNNKFFMSYSAVQMNGTQDEPIKIISNDNTANGFTVLQAKEQSHLEYVVFDGLNTFDNYGWTLTGAVTFFESDVSIKNSVFNNNVCEDGLNIVHSKFKLENSTVSNAFSDGFDADFCQGEVVNSHFFNTLNDCLDFSTSKITIINTDIKNAGDKGISCGEGSTIELKDVVVDGAVIGVASKDKSQTTITNIKLLNCLTGFSAFQKKPEYGPSSIKVKGYSLDNVEQVKSVDLESTILLENQNKNK